jgi:hypothetical protein
MTDDTRFDLDHYYTLHDLSRIYGDVKAAEPALGDTDIREIVTAWQTTCIKPDLITAFIDAGCFDPDTAVAMLDAGMTPDDAAIEFESQYGYTNTVGYVVSNGDATIEQVIKTLVN